MSSMNHSPERVQRARERAGMTQMALAEQVGCGKSLISEIESGTRNCTPARLEKIAQVLGVRTATLASEHYRPRRSEEPA
ncbi:hypothetical protein GCM10023224_05710 [Streptomonospora halophila]|uniref:HTH cro/C1-type domain-containing protein n=1 Tax=Streptomonospora halophila TaxID=427369 RepID=A0ABP9G712_9ACTN